jgi:RNA polymerase sigma-70 factor (ECF subfamily)
MDSFITVRMPVVADSGNSRGDSQNGELPTSPDLGDEALLFRVGAGDRESLAVLFRRYSRLVYGIARRILKDSAEAEDLVQDVFVLICRLAGTFDSSKASVQFWIVQMTYRRAISRRQYLNSRHFYTRIELDEQVIQDTSAGFEPSGASLDQRLAELDLERLFRSLSEDQQKTLRLHFVEGYTLDEIAKMLGQTKGNIRHHSFRGLERLRKLVFGGELPGTRAV